MNIAYVYPWDVVGDPTAPDRLAALGVEAVALAASYHSTRAATPYHPSHRVLDVPYSAFYLPVRPSAWSRLVPATPTWTAPDAYLQARDALKAAGLKVHAWTVLTHNSHLGTAHPDLVVRNAFGDPYPYALCPAHEDVVDYCERLVREILEVGEPDGLILEACGPLGFGHQSIHEKTAGADWSSTDADLLSLCFCTACADRYPSPTRAQVRTAIDHPPPPTPETPSPATRTTSTTSGATSPTTTAASGTSGAASPATTPTSGTSPAHLPPFGGTSPNPTPDTVDQALGPLADEVRSIRVALSTSLRKRLIATARSTAPDTPITLHANPDPWAAGAFAPLPAGEPEADVLVANCWGDPTTDAIRLARLKDLSTPGQRIGAYVLALPPRPADPAVLADHLSTYTKAGATEFHLYHAGLASPQRLTALAEALHQHHP
ncbi:hypothetical protein [Nonomuraea jiangxiensis]|uniref:Alanine-rich protein n=1 Tax=Nonomuraea jiangxiensis TaxID=633440 RepID=A0A1G7Y4E4_9ACTN|nr:hypothetical protein [Nonomuraea jiangxiensis]SDG91332.1 hypothetical protein SAMN05421869_1012 [Nonomuraea jiangxiensis]